MNWEWVVPVIVLVVWILTHVIRPPEEQPRDNKARRIPDRPPDRGQAGRGQQQQQPSEVDRFLDEVNRMRRQGEQTRRTPEQTRRAPEPTRQSSEQARRTRTAPPSDPRRQSRPRQTRPQERRTQVAQEVLTVEAVVPQRVEPMVPIQVHTPATPVLELAEVVKPVPAPARPAAAGVQPRPPSAAMIQVLGLLKSPESLKTAIILQEVLGPPKSVQQSRNSR